MKYNYVYLNSSYLSKGILDENEYNAICLRDIASLEGVQVIQSPLEHRSRFKRRLFNGILAFDRKYKKHLSKFFFSDLIQIKFKSDKPICFLVSSYQLPLSYFTYLRDRYPGCKIVKIYRDLVAVQELTNPEYSINNVFDTFDLCMSFDKCEAEKYGMIHFDEIESKIKVEISDYYPISDVFIAAKAKDRLSKLISAYDIFEKAGLRCEFYLTGVNPKDRIARKGITYAERNLDYPTMLYKSVNSKCMLDINQKGAVGYTSRILEAIIYNKKIICDNSSIKETRFYNPNYIQCVDDISEIDPEFVINDIGEIDYNYQNDFSPIRLLELVEANI